MSVREYPRVSSALSALIVLLKPSNWIESIRDAPVTVRWSKAETQLFDDCNEYQ